MLTIFGMKNLFIEDIRKVAISNNNIEKFNGYSLGEGKHKILLPEGWMIEENQISSSKELDAALTNQMNIEGSICILDGDLEYTINQIINNNSNESVVKKLDNNWNIVIVNSNNYINKYYLREYSEGKVLIIKYYYKEGKIKNSMNVVFEVICNSFE
jgi:hypothetical protein